MSEKRARTRHLTIRLTEEERAAIDASAERSGLKSGSYARNVLLGAPTPRQVRRPQVDKIAIARLLGELGSVGNNLNQIARGINRGRELYDEALQAALAQLRDIRDASLRALGRDP
jgi:hypothetical protein